MSIGRIYITAIYTWFYGFYFMSTLAVSSYELSLIISEENVAFWVSVAASILYIVPWMLIMIFELMCDGCLLSNYEMRIRELEEKRKEESALYHKYLRLIESAASLKNLKKITKKAKNTLSAWKVMRNIQ